MKIIIIGGGSAGLGAANTILKDMRNGLHTVQLFEATEEFGGRAKTVDVKGLHFDMGCVYLQDPGNPKNPWPKIIEQLQAKTYPDQNTNAQVRIKTHEGYETKNYWNVPDILKCVQYYSDSFETTEGFTNKVVAQKPENMGQFEYFGLGLTHLGPFSESTEPWHYLASDCARQKGNDEWGLSEFVEGGLGNVVKDWGKHLTDIHPERLEVHFDNAIQEIRYADGKVVVVDSKRTVHEADACIITVPVSLLKTNSIKFVPTLPDRYTTALKALNLGSYKKLVFTLHEYPKDIANDVNYYLYNEKTAQGIWQFFRLPFYPPNMFVAHTAGAFACALDKLNDAEVATLFKDIMLAAYGKDIAFGEVLAMTNWSNSKYALGAYSYTTPLSDEPDDRTAFEAREVMRLPVDNLVYFAGEAYYPDAYGTLHGAYISGEEAARKAIGITVGAETKNPVQV